MLEASVQEGASIDLVMEMGGLVSLTTSWLSIANDEFHAGDVTEEVVVEIDIGDGIVWEMTFDQNGALELVLPSDVTFSLTVSLKQFSMN